MKKTYIPKAKDIKRTWHLKDADGKVLGRLASEIAGLLMGKQKKDYTSNLDMGDFVVVTNAGKIKVTGKKEAQKVYYKHSGYPGGFREIKYGKYLKEQPEKIIYLAVKRMLPANRLLDKRLARLKIFKAENHKYEDKFNK
jgi:large subunit ribosomal protein L13